jgi:hypothetical protein
VLLLPASIYQSAFGATPEDRFRIGYGRLNTAAGVAVLRDYLERGAGKLQSSA